MEKISTDEVKSEPLRASRKSGTVAITQRGQIGRDFRRGRLDDLKVVGGRKGP